MTLRQFTIPILIIFLLSPSLTALGRVRLLQQEDAPAQAQPSASELTNEDVIRMVKAGLSEDLIINKIYQSKTNFDTSPEALIKLKEVGVSDTLLKAMLNPQAAAAASPSSNPGNSAPVPEPGVYLEEKGQLVQLEPTIFTQTKSAMWGAALTYGIKSGKFKAVSPGPHAKLQTSQTRPVFFFYFASTASGLTFPVMGANNPNEFVLVKMEEKKDRRELMVAKGRFNYSFGIQKESMREFSSEKLGPGQYKVVPNVDLKPGEYCFYYATATSGPVGGTGGKVFDFRVVAPH